MKMTTVLAAAAITAIAGTAMGQTINQGNTQFVYNAGAIATSPTVANGEVVGSANFRQNTAVTTDQLYQTYWHYRVDNDTREFAYHAPANPFVAAGNTMTGTFNLPSSAPVFSSTLTYVLTDTDGAGTAQAQLTQTNRITNTTSASHTMSIFSYADFDPNGSFGHPYTYDVANQQLTGTSGAITFFYKGVGANAYQANDYTSAITGLRGRLYDTTVTNLNNTVDNGGATGPGSGDFTGAFQWNLTLAAGQSVDLVAILSINIPTPGASALLGLAGLVGIRRRR